MTKCIFEDCNRPASRRSHIGLCEVHLSDSEWQQFYREHDRDVTEQADAWDRLIKALREMDDDE